MNVVHGFSIINAQFRQCSRKKNVPYNIHNIPPKKRTEYAFNMSCICRFFNLNVFVIIIFPKCVFIFGFLLAYCIILVLASYLYLPVWIILKLPLFNLSHSSYFVFFRAFSASRSSWLCFLHAFLHHSCCLSIHCSLHLSSNTPLHFFPSCFYTWHTRMKFFNSKNSVVMKVFFFFFVIPGNVGRERVMHMNYATYANSKSSK